MPVLQLEALAPDRAIEWFKRKGLRVSFDWRDLWQAADEQAFSVAGITSLELLSDIQEELTRALESGMSFEEFQKHAEQILRYHGWYGPTVVEDPISGRKREVSLGSAHRLETIFRSNIGSALNAGRDEQIAEVAAERIASGVGKTYLRYVAVPHSARTCDLCESLNGMIRPIDDPVWSFAHAPLHPRCRCFHQSLSEDDMAQYGYTVSRQRKLNIKTYTNDRTGYTVRALEGAAPGWGRHDYNAQINQLFDAYLKSASPENRKAIIARRPKRTHAAVIAFPVERAAADHKIRPRNITGRWASLKQPEKEPAVHPALPEHGERAGKPNLSFFTSRPVVQEFLAALSAKQRKVYLGIKQRELIEHWAPLFGKSEHDAGNPEAVGVILELRSGSDTFRNAVREDVEALPFGAKQLLRGWRLTAIGESSGEWIGRTYPDDRIIIIAEMRATKEMIEDVGQVVRHEVGHAAAAEIQRVRPAWWRAWLTTAEPEIKARETELLAHGFEYMLKSADEAFAELFSRELPHPPDPEDKRYALLQEILPQSYNLMESLIRPFGAELG
jgi:SPP1 gp7 family putative phage head morphogenesis protein